MILVFGYQTPSAYEVPDVIYLGDNGDEAQKVCDESKYPRIAMVVNPMTRPIKHWTEEAGKEWEAHPDHHEPKISTSDIVAKVLISDERAPAATQENLEDYTVEQLKELAAREGADLSGAHVKADIIAAIEKHRAVQRGDLDLLTVEELKALALQRNITLKANSHKADIITAIKQG